MADTIAQIGKLWPLVAGVATAIITAVLSIARSQWRDDEQEKQINAIRHEHDECKAMTQRTLNDIHGRVSNIEGQFVQFGDKLDTAIRLIERRNGVRNG